MPEPTLEVVVALKDRFSADFDKIVSKIEAAAAKINKALAPAGSGFGAITTGANEATQAMGGLDKATAAATKKTKTFATTFGASFKRLSHDLFSLRNVFVTWIGGYFVKSLADVMKKSEDLSYTFSTLTKSLGINASEGLRGMREAMKGTVTDMDLMAYANKAMMLGVIRSSGEMAMFSEMARRLGKAMGWDLSNAFERLILGIARQSDRLLDEIGITISANDAYEKYARTINKAQKDFTENDRMMAYRSAVLEAGRDRMKMLGVDVLSTSEKFSQLHVAASNAWKALAEGIKPAFLELSLKLSDALKDNKLALVSFGKALGEFAANTMPPVLATFASILKYVMETAEGMRQNTADRSGGAAKVDSARIRAWKGDLDFFKNTFLPKMTGFELQALLDLEKKKALLLGAPAQNYGWSPYRGPPDAKNEEGRRQSAENIAAIEQQIEKLKELGKAMGRLRDWQALTGYEGKPTDFFKAFGIPTDKDMKRALSRAQAELQVFFSQYEEMMGLNDKEGALGKFLRESGSAIGTYESPITEIFPAMASPKEWVATLNKNADADQKFLDRAIEMRADLEALFNKPFKGDITGFLSAKDEIDRRNRLLRARDTLIEIYGEMGDAAMVALIEESQALDEIEQQRRDLAAQMRKDARELMRLMPETFTTFEGAKGYAEFTDKQQKLDDVRRRSEDLILYYEAHGDTAKAFWKAGESAIDEYMNKLKSVAVLTKGFFQDALGSVQNFFSDMIFGALTNDFGKFKDYLIAFLKDLAKALSELASQMMMLGIIKGVASLALSIGGGATGEYKTGSDAPDLVWDAMQYGGIRTKPTRAIIAERGAEAVVPLPNGRAIPVDLRGGMGQGTTVVNNWNIQTIDSTTFEAWLVKSKKRVEAITTEMAQSSPSYRSAHRRI